jgi:hypothetical protein
MHGTEPLHNTHGLCRIAGTDREDSEVTLIADVVRMLGCEPEK